MARKLTVKIIDGTKYEEMTGAAAPKKGTVSLHPDEADVLFKVKAVELTPLQQAVLEKYNQPKEKKELTSISEEADALRKNPDFYELCIKECHKKIAGETKTIRAIGLISCGRLVENAEKTSYNSAPNDESGIGKDYITRNTLQLFVPKEHLIHRTRISPAVLNYWHNPKFEPNWSWDGKVLYLEDVGENVMNSEVMKTFLSHGSRATILIKQLVVDIDIKGKPIVVMTFASSIPNKEIIRRLQLIPLDDSEAQTKRIKQFIANKDADGVLPNYEEKFLEAIASLIPIKVRIPKALANAVTTYFPNTKIARTLQSRFFDYLKASCAFHQYQREKDEEDYYIAEKKDYEIARQVFIYSVFSESAIPVTKNEKRIIDVMKKEEMENATAPELMRKINFLSKKGLYTSLNILADKGFVKKDSEERNYGSEEKPFIRELDVFSLTEFKNFSLPEYSDLIPMGKTTHATQGLSTTQTTYATQTPSKPQNSSACSELPVTLGSGKNKIDEKKRKKVPAWILENRNPCIWENREER